MISVLIPSCNEEYLQKTIDDVLDKAVGDVEVIAVLDGYKPLIRERKNLVLLHNDKPVGQRQAVNQAARVAKGKYLMKLDAHCMMDSGWDEILKRDCPYDWTVVPRMYVLDAPNWKPKWSKRTDFMFIRSPYAEEKPFQIEYYDAKCYRAFPKEYRAYKKADWRKDIICPTMACIGACFFMHKDRYWELGGMDEGHGHWGQMGIEVACKAWLSGGALMVNKNT